MQITESNFCTYPINFILAMSSTDSYKKVTLFTNPYGGRRDALWHVFEADFSAGAQAEFCSDDDESVWLALQDKDTGGNHASAIAMPAAQSAEFSNYSAIDFKISYFLLIQ